MALIEVVKYNGGPDVFAWKYPNEELGTWTQLVVNESQEAVLFKGGKALDIFQSGRHTLDTANIPILNKVVNLPFGGRSPFSAEIWYINKVFSLDIKWGTATPIQIQDPKYGVFIPVRSNGVFGIQIEDSKQFLIKLVGTTSQFDKQSITNYFRGLYITKVKDAVSSYVIHKKISLLEINAYIDELSTCMKEKIETIMKEYGIKLVNFYVNDISLPEDDTAVATLKDALAKKAKMDIMGYSYQQERSFDTIEGAAKNPGADSASIMGAGMGLGMGLGMGGTFGNAFSSIADEISLNKEVAIECPKCNFKIIKGHKFCSSCGYDISQKNSDEVNIVCSECGAKLNPKSKFCPACGDKYDPCPECGADMKKGATVCTECGYQTPKNCNNCGATVPNTVKFCSECGTAMIKSCKKCNAQIEGSPKFCPECGEKI